MLLLGKIAMDRYLALAGAGNPESQICGRLPCTWIKLNLGSPAVRYEKLHAALAVSPFLFKYSQQ